MKVSDYMQLKAQGFIPNLEEKKDAGLLAIGTTGAVKDFIGGLGFGLSLPQFIYNSYKNYGNTEHPFLEALATATPNQWASNINNWIDEKLNIPEYKDMTPLQKTVDFIGGGIPLFASGGTYGAVKLGSKFATKKATLKAARDAAKNLGKTTPEILNDLKTTKDILANKHNFLEYLAPGYQVSTGKYLGKELRTKGLVGKDLRKAIRKEQLSSLITQASIDAGLQESMAAYTDNQGLIGDYSIEDQEKLDTLQEIADDDKYISLAKDAAIATLLGFGTYKGYKFIKNLTKQRYDIVADQINKNLQQQINDIKFAPSDQSKDFMSQVSNKNHYFNSDWMTEQVSDSVKDLLSVDNDATIASSLSRPNAIAFDKNTGSFRINESPAIINDTFVDWLQNNPKNFDLLNDFADTHMRLSNFINVQNKILKEGGKPIDVNQRYIYERKLKDLYKKIKANPDVYKTLQDASQVDKNLLESLYNAHVIGKNDYEYLLKNRTISIDGEPVFLYQRAIKDNTEDLPTLKNKISNVKNKVLYTNSDKVRDFSTDINERTQFDFSPSTRYVPYANDFYNKAYNTMYANIKIGKIRTTLFDMLKHNPDYIKGLENYGSFPELADKFINKYQDFLDNPTKHGAYMKKFSKYIDREIDKRVKTQYIADIKFDRTAKDRVSIHDNPYSLLNSKEDLGTFHEILTKSGSERYTDETILKYLEEARNNPNSNFIAIPNGEDGYALFKTNYHIKKALDASPEILSMYDSMWRSARNMFQQATTGNLNPAFAPNSAIYGTFEAISALPLIFKRNNLNNFTYKKYFSFLRNQAKSAKDYVKNRLLNDIVHNFEISLQNINLSPQDADNIRKSLETTKRMLDKNLLSMAERHGVYTYSDPNTWRVSDQALANVSFTGKIKKIYGKVRGTKFIKYLRYCLDALRNSANNGLLLQLAAEKHIEKLGDKAAMSLIRNINRTISDTVTDTKLQGIYESLAGKTAGFLAKDIPYGHVMIESIVKKIDNLNIPGGTRFIKAAIKEVKNSEHKALDTLLSLQLGTKMLKDNKYIKGLIQTIAIPTTFVYLWNHKDAQSRESYYSLSDYDKASKLILVDVFGKGRHLSLPGDQECMVVSKLFETLLDSVIHGSEMQETDPAFKQSAVIMQALSRSLDISNLIYPEAMLNLAGYRSNFGAETLAGEPVIQKLPRNVKNLDGSETAVQDGLLSQETRALLSTIGGALMASLGNSAEQFNIGTRDVGIGQGVKDAVNSFVQQQVKQLPGIPSNIPYVSNRRFIYRATNQTSLENKKMRETIDKLKQLVSVSKRGNKTFGNRKDTNVPNLAQVKPLTPELQSKVALANIILPEYNKNILPLYDKVGALYKQLNAYNATGRDLNGNVVSTTDRFAFQQKVNIELQDLQKQIYTQYKLLEKILTEETGHDINLTDITTIQ